MSSLLRTLIRTSSTMTAASGNRLRFEKSPYLLQHANNPIHWLPFGDEAISKAKSEDKPIFLSVGYATCHWCHVMEKESFESQEVADLMNTHFVSIKVDREERPDIDRIYMKFLLLVNKSGGWPMSIWLTPELKPIAAGTYFPKDSRWGMPGFTTILRQIADTWEKDREKLISTGQSIIETMQGIENKANASDEPVGTVEETHGLALRIFKYTFDKEWGGFNGAPKFPEVSKLNFLLHSYAISGEKTLLDMVSKTLRKIANGGIHDHVFGGFSRYAVDRKWHVPHFEKMLYDQAQLLSMYSKMFQIDSDPFYIEQCDKTFEYLVSDLRHPSGGFYSGEDADSLPSATSAGKIEGSFYVWSHSKIQVLFEEEAARFPQCGEASLPFEIFSYHFDVQETGNVSPDNDPHGHFLESNILFVRGSILETEKKYPNVDVKTVLRVGCEILREERKKRPRPDLDTKFVCSWNGLMLSALCDAAAASDTPERKTRFLDCARQLYDFASDNFYCKSTKTLQRTCYAADASTIDSSHVKIPGFLDDYAFLIRGILSYYRLTLDESFLMWAKELQEQQDLLFWDPENGAYFYTEQGAANVVIRLKEDHDGAEPCGNSVAIWNLQALHEYFGEEELKTKFQKAVEYFLLNGHLGYSMAECLISATMADRFLDTLVVVGDSSAPTTEKLLRETQTFAPSLIVVHIDPGKTDTKLNPTFKSYKMVNNQPTAYLCRKNICQPPITEPEELRKALKG